MQQIGQYVSGERDYTLIKGGTGPLVYPAAHVYIYTGLYRITNGGKDVLLAQTLFAVLYVGVLGLVMACYRMAKVGCLLCEGGGGGRESMLMMGRDNRRRRIFSHCWCCQSACTVSSSYDYSTMAWPSARCSRLSICISAACGRSGR